MATDTWHRRGRRQRCRGAGGRNARKSGLAAAAVAYLADDLRDPQGLARPALRRAARFLEASRLAALRRAGGAYLRLDRPPAPPLETAEIIEGTAIEVADEARSVRSIAPRELEAPGRGGASETDGGASARER